MIDEVIDNMYSTGDENKFLEVTYAKGEREIFYFKDFSSGAMLENIVARGQAQGGEALPRGRGARHHGRGHDRVGARGVQGRTKISRTPPNPDDWARISGRKGERIINVRTLITGMERKEQTIENVSSGQGQYL
jgi:proteasome-associated ATPase